LTWVGAIGWGKPAAVARLGVGRSHTVTEGLSTPQQTTRNPATTAAAVGTIGADAHVLE
jgi:hypothetical protein